MAIQINCPSCKTVNNIDEEKRGRKVRCRKCEKPISVPAEDEEAVQEEPKRKEAVVPLDPRKLVYIKRWFRSKHAVIFRMSNKTVQVIFIDQTEVIINSVAKSAIDLS